MFGIHRLQIRNGRKRNLLCYYRRKARGEKLTAAEQKAADSEVELTRDDFLREFRKMSDEQREEFFEDLDDDSLWTKKRLKKVFSRRGRRYPPQTMMLFLQMTCACGVSSRGSVAVVAALLEHLIQFALSQSHHHIFRTEFVQQQIFRTAGEFSPEMIPSDATLRRWKHVSAQKNVIQNSS
jgi:hypothetical protein